MLPAAILAAGLLLPYPQQVQAAVDYGNTHPGTRILDFNSVPANERLSADLATRLMLPHLSRELSLAGQKHVWLPDTAMAAIDLDGLGWSVKTWQTLASYYPYSTVKDPLIMRADWLLSIVGDSNAVDQFGKPLEVVPYDLLVFNGKIPKTKTEWLKGLGVSENLRLAQGLIIPRGKSGVALNTRLLRHDPGAFPLFQTFDSFQDAGANDPFANLAGGPKFDAQELIASLPKIDPVTQARVIVQAYTLTDGKGNLVRVADTRAVGGGNFLGDNAIRYPGSCLVCHAGPYNGSRENEVRDAVAEGVEITTKDKRLQFDLEAFYLGSVGQTVERAEQDYTAFAEIICGTTPKGAHAAYNKTVTSYAAPLDLSRAAVEMYCEPKTLALALGWYSERLGVQDGTFARAALLAHGKPVSRKQWEATVYHQCRAAMAAWNARAK